MKILKIAVIALAGLTYSLTGAAAGNDVKKKPGVKPGPGNPLEVLLSGYNFRSARTQAMQDDDFENPAFLWVEQGAELWSAVDGKAGKSCASCHNDAENSMKGVGAKYPVYREDLKNVINLEQKINECRTRKMGAKAWKWESAPLLAMTVYVKHQSRGMPVNVSVKGEGARKHWEAGKKFYYTRRGQLDMSCASCHETYQGVHIRSDFLSQGHANGFPAFRLKWQKLGSLHRRFKGCNKNIRAQPYKPGSQEYTDLEYYVTWRGNGMPIETPAVRQ